MAGNFAQISFAPAHLTLDDVFFKVIIIICFEILQLLMDWSYC